jgi:hypothetical protein
VTSSRCEAALLGEQKKSLIQKIFLFISSTKVNENHLVISKLRDNQIISNTLGQYTIVLLDCIYSRVDGVVQVVTEQQSRCWPRKKSMQILNFKKFMVECQSCKRYNFQLAHYFPNLKNKNFKPL